MYGKNVSRYGFPSCHCALLFPFPFSFHVLTQPISPGQLDFPRTASLSHSLTPRRLMYPKPRREAIRNYWKTTKMCFKILISQKLPRRALGPEMSLSSLLQRRRCVKPGHPAQGDLSEVTDLGEREPRGDTTFTSGRSAWCHVGCFLEEFPQIQTTFFCNKWCALFNQTHYLSTPQLGAGSKAGAMPGWAGHSRLFRVV